MDNQQPSPNRKCTKCGQEKPLSEFPIYGGGRRRHSCKECFNAYHERWRSGLIEPIDLNAPSRTCRSCGVEKPLDDFALVYAQNTRGQNYRKHTCAVCERRSHAERMRRLREQTPEKYREHQRSHRQRHLQLVRQQRRESGQRLKDDCYAAYGGYRCVCCGETQPSMLTLDHIAEDGAAHRNALNGGRGRKASVDIYRRLRDAGYPATLQVLCYNCNISKHRNGGICAHQIREGSEAIPSGSTPQARRKRTAPLDG